MNFEQYIPLAVRTLKPLPEAEQFDHCCMGIIGEIGELTDAIKRHLIYGKELDVVNVKEECGDLLWYCAAMCHTYKITLNITAVKPRSTTPLPELLYRLTDAASRLSNNKAGTALEELVSLVQTILARFSLTLQDAMTANIEKLAKRYGDKYSDFAALNRNLSAERQILQGA